MFREQIMGPPGDPTPPPPNGRGEGAIVKIFFEKATFDINENAVEFSFLRQVVAELSAFL